MVLTITVVSDISQTISHITVLSSIIRIALALYTFVTFSALVFISLASCFWKIVRVNFNRFKYTVLLQSSTPWSSPWRLGSSQLFNFSSRVPPRNSISLKVLAQLRLFNGHAGVWTLKLYCRVHKILLITQILSEVDRRDYFHVWRSTNHH